MTNTRETITSPNDGPERSEEDLGLLTPTDKAELLRMFELAISNLQRRRNFNANSAKALLQTLRLLYAAFSDEPRQLRCIGHELTFFSSRIAQVLIDREPTGPVLDSNVRFTLSMRTELWELLNTLASGDLNLIDS